MEFPTGAKAMAAIGLALTAFVGAFFYYQGLDRPFGSAYQLWSGAAAIGFVVGWSVLGKKPGYGGFESLASALTALVIMYVFIAMAQAFAFILRGMINGSYFDPIATVTLYFRISLQYLIEFLQPNILISTVFGALVTGRIAGLANLHWR